MRVYLINLERRKDRLKAMEEQVAGLGLDLERVVALDAGTAGRDAVNGRFAEWFAKTGPLGEIPAGDKACLLSHRAAWERFASSRDAHAVFLEDDVRLSKAAGPMLACDAWIPAGAEVVKLEHYGPPGQRVLLADLHALGEDFLMGRMLSRHTGGAAYILSRKAAGLLLAETCFDLAVDHLLFNPNNSKMFARLAPWQLWPAIARQQEFVGEKSDIEKTREGLRSFGSTYVRRELVRFGYDLRLIPRQIAALLSGAKFVAMKVAD
jgi:glycosyl transferase family 25